MTRSQKYAIAVSSFVASFVAAVVVGAALALDFQEQTTGPVGKVGTPYSWTVTTAPGSGSVPLTWTVPHSGEFPPGLTTRTTQDGRFLHIEGTPTKAGTFKFFIQLRDSACCPFTTEEEFTIQINPGTVPPPPPPPTSAFPIAVDKQDATTYTLVWPQQKADGYVFYFGGLERSRTRDPKRVFVRVSKGWPEYRICPGDLVTGQKACGVFRP